MDFSKNSDRRVFSAAVKYTPRSADHARFLGHRGGVIAMHRALTRFVLDPLDLIMSSLLVLLFSFTWIISLPWLCRMWGHVLENGMKILSLHAYLGFTGHHITPYVYFMIPFPEMEGITPDAWTWWSNAAVVCLLYSASYFFPKKLTPITYLLRAVLFIQITALMYFLMIPARFPHTPDSYMEGLVSYRIVLITAVPALFGLTYYIFEFRLIKKIAITILTMSYLSLCLPVQILLQAMVLEKSVLYMPILYMVFGLPVDILIILAFYSWGMSWASD